MFNTTGNKTAKFIAEKTDSDLTDLFAEIHQYKATGTLHGDLLLACSAECFGTTDAIRSVEDAVLFEMARRYANNVRSGLNNGFGHWRNAKKDPPPMCEPVIGLYDIEEEETGAYCVEEVFRHNEGFTGWHGNYVPVRKWMPFPDDDEE